MYLFQLWITIHAHIVGLQCALLDMYTPYLESYNKWKAISEITVLCYIHFLHPINVSIVFVVACLSVHLSDAALNQNYIIHLSHSVTNLVPNKW